MRRVALLVKRSGNNEAQTLYSIVREARHSERRRTGDYFATALASLDGWPTPRTLTAVTQ